MATAGAIWVRLEYRRTSVVVVSYLDSLGHTHQAPLNETTPPPEWHHQPLLHGPNNLYWPQSATADLLSAIAEAPSWRLGPFGSGPVPIAVIIVPPTGDESAFWETTTDALLETLGVARTKYSISFDAGWTAEPNPLELPLEIGVLGSPLPDVEAYTRSIGEAEIRTRLVTREMARDLPDLDVLVGSSTDVQHVLRARKVSGPRLVVVENHEQGPKLRAQDVPDGTSIVGLPFATPERNDRMIREIVAGLVHNLPLHEAVAAAGRAVQLDSETRHRIRVLTTPTGLNQLQLDPLLDRVRLRVKEIANYRNLDGLHEVLNAQGVDVPEPDVDLTAVRRAVDQGSALVRDFTRESVGLSPVAHSTVSLEAAGEAVRYVQSVAEQITDDPDLLHQLEEAQQRRVTIWVSEGDGALGGVHPAYCLTHTSHYDLHVGVGLTWENDLVPSNTPSIDPILPPTPESTYPITVAVFSDAAVFRGPTKQRLDLTRIGPCGPITFAFQTPDHGAQVRIRIFLYYKRHLLQVFNLDAKIGRFATQPVRGRGLSVRVLFSRVRQLTRVDSQLDERALAIASNVDSHRRHRLMFDTGDGLPFDERALTTIQTFYRSRLAEMYGKQRKAKLNEDALRFFITELAVRGRGVWDRLFTSASPELQETLLSIAEATGPSTIQYLRLQPTFAFPWPLVYDWEVSDMPADRAKAKICLGSVDGQTCNCTSARTDVICVRGFWGIRNVIEEFVRSNKGIVDRVERVAHTPGASPVACTLGVADEWSQRLVTTLQKRFGTAVVRLGVGDSIYGRLRDERQRPTVLIVIGHMSGEARNDAPDPPRITVEALEQYLHTKALVRELKRGRWQSPHRPVVMLLACDSAADELGQIVPSFVTTLASLGAASIVACEEKIDTSLAADLADWTVCRINSIGPGEALRSWRAKLLAESNPCGFLFSCFGNAHVTDPQFPPVVRREKGGA